MRSTYAIGLRSYMLLAAALCTGCHATHAPSMNRTSCVCAPHGECAGYYPTCWRQWPSSCPTCLPTVEANVTQPPMGSAPFPPPAETVPPPAPQPRAVPYTPPDNLPVDPLMEEPPPAEPPLAEPPVEDSSLLRRGTAPNAPTSTRPPVAQVEPGQHVEPSQRVEPASAVSVEPPRRPLAISVPRPGETVVLRHTTLQLREPPRPPAAAPPRLLDQRPISAGQ